MNPGFDYLLRQLLFQTPVFLVAIVGIVLSLIYFRRSRGPALLTLCAMSLLLVGNILFTTLNAYSFSARLTYTWSTESFTQILTILGVVHSVAHAIVIALLVAAAFIGRQRLPQITS